MNPERWRQIEELYHAALECATDERAAFLAESCGADQSLREEVESLLAYDSRAAEFITSPPDEVVAAMFAAESPVGTSLGHYRILALLGQGGMGEVYRARDERLGRDVAVKLLPAVFSHDKDRLRRFEQEARAASLLNHPNIITIHEIGAADQRYFIVSEYVEGETLRQRLRSGRLKPEVALEIAGQVASALEAAHRAGIIHRDIKPENVMLRPDGLVKVLDFGLARVSRSESTVAGSQVSTIDRLSTESGVIMGTPHYMSPEQARGQKADQRTDLFSLGVMLYEMLTGRRPFEGATTSDVIAALLTAEPLPLRELCPAAPAALERIMQKCLAKEAEARWQSARELIAELKTLHLDSQAEAAAAGRRAERAEARLPTRRWLLMAAVALFLAVGLAWSLLWRRAAAVQSGQIRSLAVLPLENLSGDPQQEYFADGMTDALIGDLAKISALHVTSRTSAMRYKGTKKSLPEIARELKVDAVVEGTVQRAGDRVGIRVQLIQAASDRHLWGESYERDLRDVLGLQSEIARAIARAIQTRVTSAEQLRLARHHSVNRKAFDDYLQGRYLWNKRTIVNLEKAIEYFQSAISADPTYAPAYVGLADCYNYLGTEMIGALPPIVARRKADEAVKKALELDSELAEAHAVLGWMKHFDWDWAAAERELRLAIELNPNYANARLFYAGFLATRGRLEEAIAEANRAQELDPFSLGISAQRGFILENARRYDEAIEQLRRVLAMDQNHYQAHWILGHTYAASGRFNEAIAASEKAAALSGRSAGALGILGLAYGLAGRKDEASRVLKELLELRRRRYVSPPALANVYIGLGDRDQAFFWLEKACQDRSNYMVWLKVFPLVDPLRSDPRFDDLLRRIGLAQ